MKSTISLIREYAFGNKDTSPHVKEVLAAQDSFRINPEVSWHLKSFHEFGQSLANSTSALWAKYAIAYFGLIFSVLLMACSHQASNTQDTKMSTFNAFQTYLDAHQITVSADSSYYLILPASCITCTPWLSSPKFKSAKNLHLITAHPKRYFTNFTSVFEDSKNDFMDLSFNEHGPVLVEVIVSQKKCVAELITNPSQLQKVIPDF